MELSNVAPWPVYEDAARAAVDGIVESGAVYDYSGRDPVVELERQFSQLHGGAHALTFNSGTSALFAAFAGLGVREGDEVLVPNLTFLASASPLMWLGASPVLVDSAPDDPSIGLDEIEAAITDRTTTVVVTHLFGNPVDVEPISALCKARGLWLVEDCSHAHASTVGTRHVGTFGDAAIYSIGAGKLVSGGHGGVLVTRDPAVHDIAMLTGHFKPRPRRDLLSVDLQPYAEFAFGGNLRLSPFAAALALDHVRRLDSLSGARCANVAVMDAELAGTLTPVRSPAPRMNKSHYDIVYRLPDEVPTAMRDKLVEAMTAAGVPVSAPSTRPLSRVLRPLDVTPPLDHPLLRRLHGIAKSVPRADRLIHSEQQHDRMISFPAGRLYRPDTAVAGVVAATARVVVEKILGGRA